jgi:hypothetical protein
MFFFALSCTAAVRLLTAAAVAATTAIDSSSVIIIPKKAPIKTYQSNFKWRDLTPNEIVSWYSPADLCVLGSDVRTRFPHDIRQYDCVNITKGSRKLFCGVGMGNNNKPCFGPYGEARPSFLRGIHGFTNATEKPLTEALEQMMRTNTTLVLLGDSTMRQKNQALNCQLIRENPKLRVSGNIFGITPCDTVLTVTFPDGRSTRIYALSLGPQAFTCVKARGISKYDPIGMYLHADGIIKTIMETSNVALVANMGMWFNDITHYRSMLPIVLDWLLGIANMSNRTNVVAWHESVMQHWINKDGSGYYSKDEAKWQQNQFESTNFSLVFNQDFMVPGCCARVTNSSYMADWRNDVLTETFNSRPELRDSLHLLPFAELTRDLADLHTCNPYFFLDCTHYCYTPMMWQPLWHQIRDMTSDA